uniref:Ubiquitin-like protease family profile domain-containing protein n=1 Tax=Leersia perrieri TaxID=77586 RepID=A0A0D9VWD7_9ORYZ
MLLLDSRKMTYPTRLRLAIRSWRYLLQNVSVILYGYAAIYLYIVGIWNGPHIKTNSCIRFIADIFKTEEREENEQFINKICLEFPEVPQQNADECGIYVL